MGKIKSCIKTLFVASVVGLAFVGGFTILNSTKYGRSTINKTKKTVSSYVGTPWQSLKELVVDGQE